MSHEASTRVAAGQTEVPAGALRIAHVLPAFQIGGQERVALDLARTHRARGHHVVAFSIDERDGSMIEPFRAAGVAPTVVQKRYGVDSGLVLRLAAHFSRERVDVVHAHNPMAMMYAGPAGKLARAVVVCTKHGENLEAQRRRLVLRRLLGVFTDAYVAVSPQTAASARASRDVAEWKLRVIPNGIDVERFAAAAVERGAVRRELGIPDAAWVVGTVGRLAPEKNHVLLVQALASVLGPSLRLVVVGDGREAGAIARAAADAGATPWVHLPGARSDVPRLLGALDAFALPSLTEGLPLSVLEAMAAGLPVVASAVGGVPDVISNGEDGWLVPPRDAAALRERLLALRADPEAARALGSRAAASARRHHSIEAMSDAYLRLYRVLLGEERGSEPVPARSASGEGSCR